MHFAWISYFTQKILSRACVEHGLTEMVRAACKEELWMPFQVLATVFLLMRHKVALTQSQFEALCVLQLQSLQENMLAPGMCCAGRLSVRLKDCRHNHKWSDQTAG